MNPQTPKSAATFPTTMDDPDGLETWDIAKSTPLFPFKWLRCVHLTSRSTVVDPRAQIQRLRSNLLLCSLLLSRRSFDGLDHASAVDLMIVVTPPHELWLASPTWKISMLRRSRPSIYLLRAL